MDIFSHEDTEEFSVSGRLGFVPLTITNVSSYRNPQLFRKVQDEWQKVEFKFDLRN